MAVVGIQVPRRLCCRFHHQHSATAGWRRSSWTSTPVVWEESSFISHGSHFDYPSRAAPSTTALTQPRLLHHAYLLAFCLPAQSGTGRFSFATGCTGRVQSFCSCSPSLLCGPRPRLAFPTSDSPSLPKLSILDTITPTTLSLRCGVHHTHTQIASTLKFQP